MPLVRIAGVTVPKNVAARKVARAMATRTGLGSSDVEGVVSERPGGIVCTRGAHCPVVPGSDRVDALPARRGPVRTATDQRAARVAGTSARQRRVRGRSTTKYW